MRTTERLGLVEVFMKRIAGYSVPDLVSVREGLTKRIKKGEVSLGDSEADLMVVGAIDQLIAQREQDQAEEGMSEEQLRAADIDRLKRIGNVGQKFAERYLQEHGSPWDSATRKVRRELAKAAPPVEPTPTEPSWLDKHKEAHEAYLKRQKQLDQDE